MNKCQCSTSPFLVWLDCLYNLCGGRMRVPVCVRVIIRRVEVLVSIPLSLVSFLGRKLMWRWFRWRFVWLDVWTTYERGVEVDVITLAGTGLSPEVTQMSVSSGIGDRERTWCLLLKLVFCLVLKMLTKVVKVWPIRY